MSKIGDKPMKILIPQTWDEWVVTILAITCISLALYIAFTV